MSAAATVRVMSPEEIVAQSGGDTPYLIWPERSTVFAEREMRLRQLAAGHPMRDYLLFVAELACAQQRLLAHYPAVPLPAEADLDRAARQAVPPLVAVDWPRDPAWRAGLREMMGVLRDRVPEPVRAAIDRVRDGQDDWLESQADCLLTGVTRGLDLAAAPLIAASLQVYWAHLLLSVQARSLGRGQPFGRVEDESRCPCCASRPIASVIRSGAGLLGQRYVQCALCGLQWHMVRIKCVHCLSSDAVSYQSVQAADAPDGESAGASVAQAETCEACGHYLKRFLGDREPQVDAVADDLATLTLDLLVSESGMRPHGLNFMLICAEPDPPPDPGSS